MTLDNEHQRTFLLEAIKNVTIPGHLLDLAYDVRAALLAAQIGNNSQSNSAQEMLNSR